MALSKQIVLPLDVERHLIAKHVKSKQARRSFELEVQAVHDGKVLAQHIKHSKEIAQLMLKAMPAPEHVPERLQEDVKKAGEEITTFKVDVGNFVLRINASRKGIEEVWGLFETLVKKIDRMFCQHQGMFKWTPASFAGDLSALREAVKKLRKLSQDLHDQDMPNMTGSILEDLHNNLVMGHQEYNHRIDSGTRELKELELKMHENFKRIKTRQASVSVMEAELKVLELKAQEVQDRLTGMQHAIECQDKKIACLKEADGTIDDSLREGLRAALEDLQRRSRQIGEQTEKADGDSEETLKADQAVYADMKRKLDRSLVGEQPAGCHFIVCMDSNGNMEGKHWEQTKEAYKSFIDVRSSLHRQGDIVTTLVFNQHPICLGSGQPVHQVSHLKLNQVQPGGGALYAPVWQAVKRYAMDYKQGERKTVVLFMTDGSAEDKEEGASIARDTSKELASFGGLTTFVVSCSLDHPFEIGFMEELVLAGNNESRLLTGPDGERCELAIHVRDDTIVQALRTVASSMNGNHEDHIKCKLDFLAEQRVKREEEAISDRKSAHHRQETMLREAIRHQSEFEAITNQGAEKQKEVLRRHLRESEAQREALREEIITTAGTQSQLRKDIAELEEDRESEDKSLNDPVDGALAAQKEDRDYIRKQKDFARQELKDAHAGKAKLQETLGGCDEKAFSKAKALYTQIRQNQVVHGDEQYRVLDQVARSVDRIADALENPMTTQFNDGTKLFLVLRYFQTKVSGITCSESDQAGDFHIIVQHIADQLDWNKMGKLGKANSMHTIETTFNMVELCEEFPNPEDKTVLYERMQEKLGEVYPDVAMARTALKTAKTQERNAKRTKTEFEESMKTLPADARGESRETLAGLVQDCQEAVDAVAEEQIALQAELLIFEFSSTKTLLEKVIDSFSSIVNKQTLQKDLQEIRVRVKGFMDDFQGFIGDYVKQGRLIKSENLALVCNLKLDDLDRMEAPKPLDDHDLDGMDDQDKMICGDLGNMLMLEDGESFWSGSTCITPRNDCPQRKRSSDDSREDLATPPPVQNNHRTGDHACQDVDGKPAKDISPPKAEGEDVDGGAAKTIALPKADITKEERPYLVKGEDSSGKGDCKTPTVSKRPSNIFRRDSRVAMQEREGQDKRSSA